MTIGIGADVGLASLLLDMSGCLELAVDNPSSSQRCAMTLPICW